MTDHASASPRSRVRRVLATLPAVLAFTLLAVIAVFGHRAGWKLPKFSALVEPTREKAVDWCEEHNIPEELCVECKPELLPRQKSADWCEEHGVPECPVCHPRFAEVPGKPRMPKYDTAQALARRDRPQNDRDCPLHARRLQFADEESVRRAGIETDVVQEQRMGEYLVANGEVTFDPNRVTRYSARIPGAVVRVFKQVGDPVKAGEVLALLDGVEAGKARSEFQHALVSLRLRIATAERFRAAAKSGTIGQQLLIDADNSVSEARIRLTAAEQTLNNLGLPARVDDFLTVPEEQIAARLRRLGLPEELARSLEKSTVSTLLPITATLDGVVTARETVAGEVVDPSRVLFVVADPSRMWLTLHVRQEDAGQLSLTQRVRLRCDGQPSELTGQIDWVSPAVDEKTRTVPVRVELANADGRLRNNTFGTGRVVIREEPNAVVVPKSAVHWDGSCHVIFVRDRGYLKEGGFKVFHVRKVVPGAKDDRFTEILGGAVPGEVVATKGSAALRAELLKGDLGEG